MSSICTFKNFLFIEVNVFSVFLELRVFFKFHILCFSVFFSIMWERIALISTIMILFLDGQFYHKWIRPHPSRGLILKENLLPCFFFFSTVYKYEISLSSIFAVSVCKFIIWEHSSAIYCNVSFESCSNFDSGCDLISASFGNVSPSTNMRHLNISRECGEFKFLAFSIHYACKWGRIVCIILGQIKALPTCIQKWTVFTKKFF